MSDTTGRPRGTRNHPIFNIDRDMENQARRRNERPRNNINPRDRLFYALFIKIGHVYCRLVPPSLRTLLEIAVLIKALLLFSILSYLHFSFGRVPLNCLNTTVGSWPRDGILRVQIQPEFRMKRQLPRFYSSEENRVLFHPCHNSNSYTREECAYITQDLKAFYNYKTSLYVHKHQCYRMNLSDFMLQQQSKHWKEFESFEYVASDKKGRLFSGFRHGDIIGESNLISFYDLYLAIREPERHHIFEYAREFGFLRLSQETRDRLKIPIKVVSLDPKKEKCFGDAFSSFVLKYFLGYDDIIMNSIKKIADIENNTGYMLNVVTGDHYKFVSWGIGKTSYFISLLLMFLFTISISTLLRYCHQQVFFFIIQVLRMMDMNVVLAFPIAPLFTVILSLVGMETIMSEYFNDTTTSFYIILMVWGVDQFDSICCHTTISQKYWPRFFYLYHFIFYAYHYRFNGQYSFICLATTWFLIQHSMLYFFHNYELRAIEQQIHNDRDEEAYLDEAVQMIVEGIEMVAGQQQNNNENGEEPAGQQQDEQQQQQQDAEHQHHQQQQQPEDRQNNDPGNVPRGMVRGIATADNGNRVFLFAGEGPFLQMIREFVRQVHRRLNAPTPQIDAPIDTIENPVVHEQEQGETPQNNTEDLPSSSSAFPSGSDTVGETQRQEHQEQPNSQLNGSQRNDVISQQTFSQTNDREQGSPPLYSQAAFTTAALQAAHSRADETDDTLYHQVTEQYNTQSAHSRTETTQNGPNNSLTLNSYRSNEAGHVAELPHNSNITLDTFSGESALPDHQTPCGGNEDSFVDFPSVAERRRSFEAETIKQNNDNSTATMTTDFSTSEPRHR